MTEAIDIIAAFDAEIIRIWGEHLARPWPHVKDKMVADRWIEAGVTMAMCERVFRDTLGKRRARQLTIPFSLSYFENMVRDAITTNAAPVEDDPETARWRSRVRGWKRNARHWLIDQWGDPPGDPLCRCPKRVLKEELS